MHIPSDSADSLASPTSCDSATFSSVTPSSSYGSTSWTNSSTSSTPHKPSSSSSSSSSSPPHTSLRHTHRPPLVATLRVKTRLATRKRIVRLDNGLLHIHSLADDCADPLLSTRIVEAESLTHCAAKGSITLRTEHRTTFTLVFKTSSPDFDKWLAALQHERDLVVERFYKLCETIGTGHYARVVRGVDRRSGDNVAIKVIDRCLNGPSSKSGQNNNSVKNNSGNNKKLDMYIRREVEIVKRLSHPNVVATYDVFETRSHVYIVMEYIQAGTLLDHLQRSPLGNRLPEDQALDLAAQLLKAVQYLHSVGVIHRDIKAENVLVTSSGLLKLADFGLARHLDSACTSSASLLPSPLSSSSPPSDRSDEYCLCSVLGTPAYCPPEVINRMPYGKPVDLFSCGVLLYVLLSGALPFKGETPREVFLAITRARLAFPRSRWALVSPAARDLCRRLLDNRAAQRPTAVNALRHAWFKSGLNVKVNRAVLRDAQNDLYLNQQRFDDVDVSASSCKQFRSSRPTSGRMGMGMNMGMRPSLSARAMQLGMQFSSGSGPAMGTGMGGYSGGGVSMPRANSGNFNELASRKLQAQQRRRGMGMGMGMGMGIGAEQRKVSLNSVAAYE